jgi:uncharacterized membrane protein HdeD (DUF308 family)
MFELSLAGGIIAGVITIAVGIIILIWPKVLAYILGIYLVLLGIGTIIAAI